MVYGWDCAVGAICGPRFQGRMLLGTTTPCGEQDGGAEGEIRVIEEGEYLRYLLVRDQPGVHGLLSDLLKARASQARTWRSSFPDGHIALHAQVDEAMRPQTPIQAPPPGGIDAPCFHELTEGRLHFLIERCFLGIDGRVTEVEKGAIKVFDDEPASRLQSRHHPLKRLLVCWHMDEYQAGVDQVKGLRGQWIGANVVALDLKRTVIKCRQHAEKARVDVGHEDMADLPAAFGQPGRNRPDRKSVV